MLLRVAGRSPGKSLEMHLPADGPLSVLADGHNACISISLFFVAALLLLSFFLPHSIFLFILPSIFISSLLKTKPTIM